MTGLIQLSKTIQTVDSKMKKGDQEKGVFQKILLLLSDDLREPPKSSLRLTGTISTYIMEQKAPEFAKFPVLKLRMIMRTQRAILLHFLKERIHFSPVSSSHDSKRTDRVNSAQTEIVLFQRLKKSPNNSTRIMCALSGTFSGVILSNL